jgi:hypothetical protein
MDGHDDGLKETQMDGLLCKLVGSDTYKWTYVNYVQFTHRNNYVSNNVEVYENLT